MTALRWLCRLLVRVNRSDLNRQHNGRNQFGRFSKRIIDKVGVSLRCPYMNMTQQILDRVNADAMHEHCARARQLLLSEYAIRASTRAASIDGDKALSVLNPNPATAYLVVHKDQTPSNHHCKMGRQTADSCHEWWREPCYKLSDERG